MNSRLYYKSLSSCIASKWTVLLIDLLIVLAFMLLAFTLQWEISSVAYNTFLYTWIGVFTILCCALYFRFFIPIVGVIRFSSFVDIYRLLICLTLNFSVFGLGSFCWSLFGLGDTLPASMLLMVYILTFFFM